MTPSPSDGAARDWRALARAREHIAAAKRIVVFTGAGVSAESGVPTFRGPDGLWKSFRVEELATPEAFARDPRLVWEWYGWRRELVSRCEPNRGHLAIAEFAHDPTRQVTIVTQNVDGLHERARQAMRDRDDRAHPADDSAATFEVHGALWRDRCSGCSRRTTGRAPVDATTLDTLPRCEVCGSLLRPDVVWFGEPLDSAVIGGAFEAARGADLCLVVGTSALVYPAASVPELTAAAGGAIVEVNVEPTALTPRATASVFGAAGDVLPDLLHTG